MYHYHTNIIYTRFNPLNYLYDERISKKNHRNIPGV